MNKPAFQPLPVLLRAEPNEARWTSHSAKILRVVATLGTLFALGGTVVLCLIAFNAFPPKTLESKAPAGDPIHSRTKAPAAAAADQENGLGMPLTSTNQADVANIREDHPKVDQIPVPALNPSSSPTPAAQSEASVSDNELLNEQRPETARTNLEQQIPESARKTLEKRRRAAERKRSRLEEMYQEHAISAEAYKKGEENYRDEIAKYRTEMNARRGSSNEVERD
jgi:hypothetical protein